MEWLIVAAGGLVLGLGLVKLGLDLTANRRGRRQRQPWEEDSPPWG